MKWETWVRFCEQQRRDISTGERLAPEIPDRLKGAPDGRDQPAQRPALEQVLPAQETDLKRPVVRIVGYRVRWLDVDAFPGSCKALIDGLRACQLIPGDTPKDIILETDQVRVGSFKEEKTEILITYP